MDDISLKLKKREVSGKKVAGLRKEGLVPSVVYGGKMQPILTESPIIATSKVVAEAGRHTPVKLTIDGTKKLAIIKSIDYEPVKHSVRHVAFHAIKQNEVITTEVPIVLVGEGESPAEKAGLVILQALETIEIKAKPADLPKALEISVIGLEKEDDRLTVADIKLPEGVQYDDVDQDMELVVANVYEPSALAAANESAGGDSEEVTPTEAESDEDSSEKSGDEKADDKEEE